MADRSVEASPQLYARAGGAMYVVIIILGLFIELTRGRFLVGGDAAATAANLHSMESLWRLATATEILALLPTLGLVMVYFVLFKPVSRELNLLVTFIAVVAVAVQVVATLFLQTALFPLGDAAYLKAFSPEQLNAQVVLAIRARDLGFNLALLIFGCGFLIRGYLIFRSSFLPKALGVLIAIGGVCYATNSLALLLAPAFAGRLFPAILIPCFIGETSLALWLLFKGVNAQRWKEVNARAAQRAAAVAVA